jgi:hypothetical protein
MLAVVAATAAPMAAFADPVFPTRIGQPDCLGTTPTIIGRPTFLPVFTSLPLEAPLHQTFAIARLDKVQTDLAREPCLLGPYLSAEFTSSRTTAPRTTRRAGVRRRTAHGVHAVTLLPALGVLARDVRPRSVTAITRPCRFVPRSRTGRGYP